MKKRDKKPLVIIIFALAIVLTGVYALLTAVLNVTGTAVGATTFKVIFSDAVTTDVDKATINIDTNQTTLNVSAHLKYPGDTVTINFTIQNTGTLSAKVDDVVLNENSTTDFTIDITGLDDIKGTILSNGQTTNGSIVVTWNASSTNPTPTDVTFDATINYSQAT